MNTPPEGGNCTVSPWQGDAVSTLFIVGCGGWGDVEAHYPLSYSFNAYRSWYDTSLERKAMSRLGTVTSSFG